MSKSIPSKLSGSFLEELVDANPFIIVLEDYVLSENELSEVITVRCNSDERFKMAGAVSKEIGLDKRFYLCPPHGYDIYNRIRMLMMMGYVNRHPASDDYDKYLHLDDLKKTPAPKKLLDAGNSIFVRGRSGEGKTTLVDRILGTISTTIEHEPSSSTGGRRIKQVTWVKVDMSKGASRKAFYLDVIQQIDAALNTSFAARIPTKDLVGERLLYMIKVCRMVCLGVLIIDDVQWALSGAAANSNEKITNEFLEQLCNQLGVPILFIGTPESEKLKDFAEQTGRRLAHNGSIEIHSEPVTSQFWQNMVKEVFTAFLGVNSEAIDSNFYHLIHYYTEGNASRLKSIVASLLRRGVCGDISENQVHDAYVQEKGAFEKTKTPFIQLSSSTGKSLKRDLKLSNRQPAPVTKVSPDDACEDEDDFEDAFIIKGSFNGQ